MATRPHSPDHAALMDRVYRGQRHIYDATRKYYLFGRDRLIRELDCRPGMAVLEVGCGTGRNLELIGRQWSGVRCHGLDISSEMLKNARKRLGTSGALALGDATDFDAPALFGREGFDRVVLSYALSMIPDWQAALERAAAALAPGGELHVVDFGDCSGMGFLRHGLDAWLARFHVSPRRDLPRVAERLALTHGLRAKVVRGPFGYYQVLRLTR
ncbi:O-methyltransferase [Novosphingobium indicum]|uniref:O-methyltransferase n=1 Tax=Novosphingobium indicum TaxID=462949 RepID=A0ABQ2JHV9_9SPHN|nr:class I SAM-dependent methyltransferase [Novosphingobium indicum]GGN47835.1 O-methyltransferase [Novosphingobium indicum]